MTAMWHEKSSSLRRHVVSQRHQLPKSVLLIHLRMWKGFKERCWKKRYLRDILNVPLKASSIYVNNSALLLYGILKEMFLLFTDSNICVISDVRQHHLRTETWTIIDWHYWKCKEYLGNINAAACSCLPFSPDCCIVLSRKAAGQLEKDAFGYSAIEDRVVKKHSFEEKKAACRFPVYVIYFSVATMKIFTCVLAMHWRSYLCLFTLCMHFRSYPLTSQFF